MAKLFGRYLAIYNKNISPKYTKIAKVGLKFLPNKPSKIWKFTKVAKFRPNLVTLLNSPTVKVYFFQSYLSLELQVKRYIATSQLN